MGSGADVFVDRPEQEDEQRLREALCKRRSVRICCYESPHGEAVDPPLRAFHTVSLERLYGKSRRAPNRGHRGQHRGARRSYFRVAGERSTLVDTSPTYFPDSFSTIFGELWFYEGG